MLAARNHAVALLGIAGRGSTVCVGAGAAAAGVGTPAAGADDRPGFARVTGISQMFIFLPVLLARSTVTRREVIS